VPAAPAALPPKVAARPRRGAHAALDVPRLAPQPSDGWSSSGSWSGTARGIADEAERTGHAGPLGLPSLFPTEYARRARCETRPQESAGVSSANPLCPDDLGEDGWRLPERQGLARMQARQEKERMAKKCVQCGRDNEDSAPRCVCGSDLPAAVAIAPTSTTTTEPAPPAPSAAGERDLRLRKLLFVVWAMAYVPLFPALRSLLKVLPVYRNLIGAGVFAASAVAAWWFLGREKRLVLRIWRIVFVVWALLLLPLLLTVAEGLAAEGWPRGRFNRQIAHLLVLVLILTVPAFLTGLCALLRTYRLASALALATGLAYLVNGYLLIRATAPAKGLRLRFQDVLDVVLFGAQMGTYLSIPIGMALVVGGIMTFRAALRRASQKLSPAGPRQ
jgi:hypothetical protein